jgi:hypothetical protein
MVYCPQPAPNKSGKTKKIYYKHPTLDLREGIYVIAKCLYKGGAHMLVAGPSKLGSMLRMKRMAAGLSRIKLSAAMGGRPSPRTIFYLEMGCWFKHKPETLKLVKNILKMDLVALAQRQKFNDRDQN